MNRWFLGATAALMISTSGFAQQTAVPATPAPSTTVPKVVPPSAVGPRLSPGYLPTSPLAEILAFSPAPPAPGSTAEARDLEAARAAVALQGSPRWAFATSDAELFAPSATSSFSCAAGIDISPENTPLLDALLRKTTADFGQSGSAAKRAYKRPRPFMSNGAPTCTPDWEPLLRQDGSYPSGHSAIGFGWGLILAELMPERAAILATRGRAFADSRRVCNAHWLSDTEEGQLTATISYARLHSVPAFVADMAAVRAEIAKAKPVTRDCAAEAKALAVAAPLPPVPTPHK